ncbi:glycosyltransferase family 2 protein [uncultured Chryseobacterium sp.]|uniref:glycosyltransferase family 2 protein n=1 Tax=uncultured Chryseobacterium sp. TaxID=259322 RepID=UPI0025E09FB6|nr:glycosyltransferase family 2 protein [uncultured Chryseobacterium sp.]
MSTLSLISVIVPCYNQAQYLDECLQSVLDQTYQNWECIIVNDGSPDHTEDVAKKWAEKDLRFKYLYKENGGLSSARNAGLALSSGEWIQFLDCDDKIATDKFEYASNYFDSKDLIISNYQLFDEEKLLEDYCYFIDEELSFRNMLFNWDEKYTIPIHCAIFRKSLISDSFDENLKAKEDFIFWLHFIQNNPRYIITDNRQAFYRMHEKSMTKDHNYMLENETKAHQYIISHFRSEHLNEFICLILEKKKNTILKLQDSNMHLSIQNLKFKNSRYYTFKTRLITLISRMK